MSLGKLATAEELTQPILGSATRARRCGFLKRFEHWGRTGIGFFVEVGPQAVLSSPGAGELVGGAQERARLWATLRREQDEAPRLLTALGGLSMLGAAGRVERILRAFGRAQGTAADLCV